MTVNLGTPNPKQEQFLLSEKRRVCYGGARGGGRSWVVRAKAAMLAINYAGIKILILRRRYADLWKNHVAFGFSCCEICICPVYVRHVV